MNSVPMKFTEQLNLKKCICVMGLSKVEIKDAFWTKDEVKHDLALQEWNNYLLTTKKYLKKVVTTSGVIDREYAFARGETDGRVYVRDGGIQK